MSDNPFFRKTHNYQNQATHVECASAHWIFVKHCKSANTYRNTLDVWEI